MTLSYRQATLADAPAISELVRGLARYYLDDPSSPDAGAFLSTVSPEGVAERMSAGNYWYLLAEDAHGVCGVAAVRDGTHLYHLFVRADMHGHGVGRGLWQRVLEHSRHADFTVNSSLYALPVYLRLGFVPDGDRQTKDGITFQPMVYSASTRQARMHP